MKKERINEKTPNGGDYSEIYYMDNDGNVVDENVATKAVIRECKENGSLICETWMRMESDGNIKRS
jgi:hypothetical protein